MYSLILGGGLGNQMFQYAYARFLSLEYGIDFSYNLYEYDVKSTEIEKRFFSLSNLNIINIEKIENKKSSVKNFKSYKRKVFLARLFQKAFGTKKTVNLMSKFGLVYTPGNVYKYYPIQIQKKKGVIHGGFQSPKYFEKVEDIIKKELMVKTKISNKNKDIYLKMQSTNSVAVHIRRGDYLNPRYKHLNICDEEYYKNCVDYFIKRGNYTFFVFSNNRDEIEWIKKNYTFLPKNTVFVDNNNKDYEDLQLMYSCKNFILSNSTFSWWAQYLSENSKKIVLAPSRWNLECNDEDIYQDSWIRM